MILGLLPPLFFVLVVLIFRRRGLCWRVSFLSAALVLGVLLTAATEVLSALGKINTIGLLLLWASAASAAALVFVSATERNPLPIRVTVPRDVKWMMAGVGIIFIATALVAAASAPNNWDSMTYHLSRVMHWIQNQSVAHYPTNIVRQIALNPWAEFALMHLQILSAGDSLANFVQWSAMAGSVIGVTLIASELGADLRAQACAAVVAATIPMGILQASSTQNDYVVAFWLVCFVYFGLVLKKRHTWLGVIAAGASLGLALLTKATAYLYAFPFFVWFFLSCLGASRRRALWSVLLIACAVLSINAAHYARNYELFGNPLGPSYGVVNSVFSGSALLSNVSRNLALHADTPSRKVNRAMQAGFERTFDALGLDINDPRTTFPTTSFAIAKTPRHEDLAGNPVHLLLVILAIVLIVARGGARKPGDLLPYVLSLGAAFLLFALYLRWQPWHSRLHLPLFVLWSPAIAVTLSAVSRRSVAGLAVVVLLAFSFPYLLANTSRRLAGKDSVMIKNRMDQYFHNHPSLKDSYQASALLIATRGCGNVGLKFTENDWEYPVWVLLARTSLGQFRIEHVEIENASARLVRGDFVPCAIVRAAADNRLHVSFPPGTSDR
jgi:Dolichyl-phosphate-mannose-protein mannosyltransferase